MSQNTRPPGPPRGTAPSTATTGWRGAGREITIAALLVAAVTAAAWALAGPAAAGFTALSCAAASFIALRALIEPHEPPPAAYLSQEMGPSLIFFGFWRTRSDLSDVPRDVKCTTSTETPALLNESTMRSHD